MLAAGSAGARERAASSQAQVLLKDYALSACLRLALPQIAPAATAATNLYVQLASHGRADFIKVVGMAEAWLKKPYPSFDDRDYALVKCIDFAASPAVAAVARHPDPNPDR